VQKEPLLKPSSATDNFIKRLSTDEKSTLRKDTVRSDDMTNSKMVSVRSLIYTHR